MDSKSSALIKDEMKDNSEIASKQEDNEDEFLNPNFVILEKTIQPSSKVNDCESKVSSNSSLEVVENEQGKFNSKSPAQELAEKMTPIPYKEPAWSGLPKQKYRFDVLKGGLILESIPFDKPFLVVGRFSQCDIIMQHPSISRFHCIIQHRAESTENEPCGLYVYDLDSTHGTHQNKYRVQPLVFNRLRVGHILKFGKSTRMFILQGPTEDQDAESQYTVTELKSLVEERKKKLTKLKNLEEDESDFKSEENEKKKPVNTDGGEGIDWGMSEDAKDEENEEVNPFAANEDLYLEDPKKTLRGWFEREGYDLPNYEVVDISPGQFKCKVVLPLHDTGPAPIICSIDHKGKKKEAVLQCALEACRILERKGLLRQATHESHKRQKKNWSENDYYASDEDDFLDRTGDIDQKRRMRKRKSEFTSSKGHIDTYDSLTQEYDKVTKEIERLERLLSKANKALHCQEEPEADQDFDDFMKNLSSSVTDKQKVLDWKVVLNKLKKEEERLRRLVNITRPLGVNELIPKIDKGNNIAFKNEDNIEEEKSNLSSNCVPGKSESLKTAASSGSSIKHSQLTSSRAKSVSALTVHHLFLEEEEPKKMRLSKVDFEDDTSTIKPIPYDKGERRPHKYSEMLKRGREKASASPPNILHDDKKPTTLHAETPINTMQLMEEKLSTKEAGFVQDSSVEVQPIVPPLPHLKETNDGENDFKKPQDEIKLKTAKKKKDKKPSIFSFEKDYETWVPPAGQTGDGRTSLNDKLGY